MTKASRRRPLRTLRPALVVGSGTSARDEGRGGARPARVAHARERRAGPTRGARSDRPSDHPARRFRRPRARMTIDPAVLAPPPPPSSLPSQPPLRRRVAHPAPPTSPSGRRPRPRVTFAQKAAFAFAQSWARPRASIARGTRTTPRAPFRSPPRRAAAAASPRGRRRAPPPRPRPERREHARRGRRRRGRPRQRASSPSPRSTARGPARAPCPRRRPCRTSSNRARATPAS